MSALMPEEHGTVEVDPDLSVGFHDLTFLDEGDEVTVGRADIDSYAVLPADGAALLRQLVAGMPHNAAAEWFKATFGDPVNMVEFLAALEELGFLRSGDGDIAQVTPVRWTRLGRAFFSPVAWVCYLVLTGWCAVAMARSPDLVPDYHNVFFTRYVTLIEVVLFAGQVPLLLIHESFHALAGRRLGLRSRLSIGRRLYYIVFETSMDGLVTVPRRRRYLPMLAGMLADILVFCTLTLVADLTRDPGGNLSMAGRVCLALAFTTVLRFVWQFSFYLQTDIYHVICVAVGCLDLQAVARRTLRNRVNRVLRRPDRLLDDSTWYPPDRAVARWYSWLLLAGYTVSIATLTVAVAPTAYRFLTGVFARFTHNTTAGELTDSLVFLALNLLQLAVLAWVTARGRHQRASAPEHLLS